MQPANISWKDLANMPIGQAYADQAPRLSTSERSRQNEDMRARPNGRLSCLCDSTSTNKNSSVLRL